MMFVKVMSFNKDIVSFSMITKPAEFSSCCEILIFRLLSNL